MISAKSVCIYKIINMINKLIASIGILGLLSNWIYPEQLVAQGIAGNTKGNSTTYEDDRIRIVVQDCTRKSQELVCQATLTSKNSDRAIDLNGNSIKLVDTEGNEYYPTSLRLANKTSENNSLKAELIENIPFKASFVFTKTPANLAQVALLQIPITSAGVNTTAKFRNFGVINPNNIVVKPPKTSIPSSKLATSSSEVNVENISICPESTKIMYRATSKDYLLYICGAKNPTHYVGQSKDGSQGIMLRLRYYDRTQFSADNGETNYTIAANRLVIRKGGKVIYQDKIEVLQALPGATTAEGSIPKSKPRKNSPSTASTNQNRNSTTQPTTQPATKVK
jgi:hypothetical protein